MDKLFLALDFKDEKKNFEIGKDALGYLIQDYSSKVGLKFNPASFIGKDAEYWSELYSLFEGTPIFIDTKFGRGPDNAERLISKYNEFLPIDYFTVSATLGEEKLREYVKIAEKYDSKVIAFTIHTKIPEKDVKKIYNNPLDIAIYNLGEIASNAGCDAMVLEAKMLENEEIVKLPIKKLVTGIRFDPSEKGSQARVSTFDELVKVKDKVDYAVISKKYLEKSILKQISDLLLK